MKTPTDQPSATMWCSVSRMTWSVGLLETTVVRTSGPRRRSKTRRASSVARRRRSRSHAVDDAERRPQRLVAADDLVDGAREDAVVETAGERQHERDVVERVPGRHLV